MFNLAFARRPGSIPAGAFYGWCKTGGAKQPFAFARQDGGPLALGDYGRAGATRPARLRTFAIITTVANDLMQPIHDRMPVVLEPDDLPVLLGEQAGDAAALLRPATEELKLWPVSSRVSSPKNDGADLLEVLGVAQA